MFSIYQIGRSEEADIRIDDASVSRLHAELIITPGREYYLTDCASSGGTHLLKDGKWISIRQEFTGFADPLLLGRYQTSTKQLLALVGQGQGAKAAGGSAQRLQSGHGPAAPDDDRPHGPVRRDEETGDIIPAGEHRDDE